MELLLWTISTLVTTIVVIYEFYKYYNIKRKIDKGVNTIITGNDLSFYDICYQSKHTMIIENNDITPKDFGIKLSNSIISSI